MMFIKTLITLASALVFSTAQAAAPKSPEFETALNLIHAYRGSGDELRRAMAIARSLATADPDSGYWQVLAAEAMSTWELGQDGEPVALRRQLLEWCDEALRQHPDFVEAHIAKARVLVRASMYEPANASIDAALALDPAASGALFLRADVYRRTGRLDEGERWYLKFIDSTADVTRKSNGYGWMGSMYADSLGQAGALRDERLMKASAAFEKSLALQPKGAWSKVNYAIFLNDEIADFDGAKRYAQLALDEMEFPMARYHLAAAQYQKLNVDLFTVHRAPFLAAVDRIARSTGVTIDQALAFPSFSSQIHQRLQRVRSRIDEQPSAVPR